MSDRHDHLVGPDGELKRHAEVQRFDLHQRIQHGLMASSFTLLVLTGWPLTTHGVGASHKLVEFFGGLAGTALLHRIAAVAMIISAVSIWITNARKRPQSIFAAPWRSRRDCRPRWSVWAA